MSLLISTFGGVGGSPGAGCLGTFTVAVQEHKMIEDTSTANNGFLNCLKLFFIFQVYKNIIKIHAINNITFKISSLLSRIYNFYAAIYYSKVFLSCATPKKLQ